MSAHVYNHRLRPIYYSAPAILSYGFYPHGHKVDVVSLAWCFHSRQEGGGWEKGESLVLKEKFIRFLLPGRRECILRGSQQGLLWWLDRIIASSQPTAPTYVRSPGFFTGVDDISTQLPKWKTQGSSLTPQPTPSPSAHCCLHRDTDPEPNFASPACWPHLGPNFPALSLLYSWSLSFHSLLHSGWRLLYRHNPITSLEPLEALHHTEYIYCTPTLAHRLAGLGPPHLPAADALAHPIQLSRPCVCPSLTPAGSCLWTFAQAVSCARNALPPCASTRGGSSLSAAGHCLWHQPFGFLHALLISPPVVFLLHRM